MPSGAIIEIIGGLLSTLFPLIGPAVAQFPTPSQILRLFVTALFVSVPDGTFVTNA
jgi:hypothetical protein